MSLSQGGFGLEAPLRIEQGDPIRLEIRTRGGGSVVVEGIVWNERPGRRGRGAAGPWVLGCVVSDPSEAFLALVADHAPRDTGRGPARRALRSRAPREEDLPRSREPLPPPKPEPEERLPRFRVRVKQVGGPRTRSVSLRARSVVEAEELVHSELADSGPGAWSVLEVVPEGG